MYIRLIFSIKADFLIRLVGGLINKTLLVTLKISLMYATHLLAILKISLIYATKYATNLIKLIN